MTHSNHSLKLSFLVRIKNTEFISFKNPNVTSSPLLIWYIGNGRDQNCGSLVSEVKAPPTELD